jgi:hypothetical protein
MTRTAFTVALISVYGTATATPRWVTLTPGQVAKLTVYKLRIPYPEQAPLSRITGDGFFKVRVQKSSGRVKRVDELQTTGNDLLDAAAIQGLSQCRFRPGVLPSIKELNPSSSDSFANEDCLLKVTVSFVLSKYGVITKGRHKGLPVREAISRDAQHRQSSTASPDAGAQPFTIRSNLTVRIANGHRHWGLIRSGSSIG